LFPRRRRLLLQQEDGGVTEYLQLDWMDDERMDGKSFTITTSFTICNSCDSCDMQPCSVLGLKSWSWWRRDMLHCQAERWCLGFRVESHTHTYIICLLINRPKLELIFKPITN
jgi:hypothetical protein